MTPPNAGTVTPKNITISWEELTDSRNGGDIPIFYLVEWTSDNITWTALNSGSTVKVLSISHVSTTPFPAGATFSYRIRAQNNVGLG
jgi:hypothetical protein